MAVAFIFWSFALIYVQNVSAHSTRHSGKSCSPLPYTSLVNGKIIATGNKKFRFLCDDGYFLAGPSQIRCKNGKWSSTAIPRCLLPEGICDSPPTVENGDVYGEDRLEGATVQYICHPGYILLGEGRRTCLRGGGWSGITPSCFAESESLQNVANRLEKQFVTKVGAYSADSLVQARILDAASTYKGLELVILFDRSSSIDPHDFQTGKNFINYLMREFGVRNGENQMGTRVAIITFGTEVDILFNVNDQNISSTEAAIQAVNELQPEGGGTAMEPALTSVFVHVHPFLRVNAKKALFLITDGEPNIGNPNISPEEMASQLREHGDFEIFTVGIGRDINRQRLALIASQPSLNHVFLLDKYSDLQDIMWMIKNNPTDEPPLSPEKCGILQPDSLNISSFWPWMAAVYVFHPDLQPENGTESEDSRLVLCGGALICSQWVLTAASCFYTVHRRDIHLSIQEVFVVLGENNLAEVDQTQMNFYAVDVHIHPDFDPFDPLRNNVALIKLNVPAPVESFRPVCLPPTDKLLPLHLNLDTNVTVAGWSLGFNEEISAETTRLTQNSKRLILAEEKECGRSIRQKKLESKNIFCAGLGYVSKENCVGNVGAPIIAEDPVSSIHHVLGILSQKTACNRGYNQFIELTKYIPWINDVTERCHIKHWL